MKLKTIMLLTLASNIYAGSCTDEDDITTWAGQLGIRDKDAAQHIKWEDEAKKWDELHPLKEKRRVFVFLYFDEDQKASVGFPSRWRGDANIIYVKRSRTEFEINEILRDYYGGIKYRHYTGK